MPGANAGQGHHGNDKNSTIIWEPLQGKIEVRNGRVFTVVREVLTQRKIEDSGDDAFLSLLTRAGVS